MPYLVQVKVMSQKFIIFKSHILLMEYMFYGLLWPYNLMVTLVWSSEAIFRSSQ